MKRWVRQSVRRIGRPALLVLSTLLACGCRDSAPPVGAGGGASKPDVTSVGGTGRADDLVTGDRAELPKFQLPAFQGAVWFTEILNETGIDFRHVSGESPAKPFPAANGSGLAAFDYDLDGQYDLYFATGTSFPLDPTRSEPTNRMYRQRPGGRYDDVTERCGLGHNGFSAGLAVGDFDSDGFPDVYVTCYGPNCLFRNQGDGTFERVDAGVDDPRWATSAAWLDYDEDGLLDLYVCNYAKWTWEKNPFCGDRARNIRMHCGPQSVEAEPHLLYRNRGDGTFEETLESAGIGARFGRGQGVVAADFNGDGHIDLYVGNDLHLNFVFFGEGNGKFRDVTEISGAAYDALGNEQGSMGVDVADVNADGRLDLFVTNFQHEYNTLYENMGGDFFQDMTNRYALVPDALPWVGWGTAFVDFNLDGWLDLIVTNGHVDDNRKFLAEGSNYGQPALAFQGSGRRFRYLAGEAGEHFRKLNVGRGLVIVDFDNDGDQDVVIGHQDAPPAVLRNERLAADGERRGTLALRLVGTAANRDAVGATVTFHADDRARTAPVKGGGSYLSASDPRLEFAVLPNETLLSLDIQWPGGATSHVADLTEGAEYVIIQSNSPEQSPLVYRQEFHP